MRRSTCHNQIHLLGATLLGFLSVSCVVDRPADPVGVPLVRLASSAPSIQVQPATLDFGLFETGETASLLVTIRNRGFADLTIREIVPPDPVEVFSLPDPPRTPLVLRPGTGLDLVVTFSPSIPEVFSATLRIVFADPDAAAVDVPVIGSASVVAVAIGVPASPCDDRIGDGAIVGTVGDDVLTGTEGDDIILGLDGNDVIHGLGGNDVLCGGPGRDRLIGGPGDDRLDGGLGDDVATHHKSNGGLYGGPGADILWGGDGNDFLRGDDPTERVRVGNTDRLFGGSGDDCLDGGPGADVLAGGLGDDRLDGGAGGDVMSGDDGRDQLFGRAGSDVMAGGDGDDSLAGEGGNDEMFGGSGNDLLHGGDDDDTLKGGDGDDQLFGDAGDDTVFAGDGQDVVLGGAGDDFIDTGLLGAIWPASDRDPNDRVAGQHLDLNYTEFEFAQLPCGG